MADNSGMMPVRLAWLLLFALACSSGSATDAPVTLNGIVTNIDGVHETITLSSQPGEAPSQAVLHDNSLTVVDRQYAAGPAHVDQLQFGDNVVVHGPRDLGTDEVTADRIVVVTLPLPVRPPSPG